MVQFTEATMVVDPRERDIVLAEIAEIISEQAYPALWTLIKELEEGAWQGGADEGYMHGHQQGWDACAVIER